MLARYGHGDTDKKGERAQGWNESSTRVVEMPELPKLTNQSRPGELARLLAETKNMFHRENYTVSGIILLQFYLDKFAITRYACGRLGMFQRAHMEQLQLD